MPSHRDGRIRRAAAHRLSTRAGQAAIANDPGTSHASGSRHAARRAPQRDALANRIVPSDRARYAFSSGPARAGRPG